MSKRLRYSQEPEHGEDFTTSTDRFYTAFARQYDLLIRAIPVWRDWLKNVLPYLKGPRILEVSFGTGYLLTQYADRYKVYGVDYNRAMINTACRNLARRQIHAALQMADVNHLPYATGSFDTVLNTMAFTGYPDGLQALNELLRMLRPGGRLILLDINFPTDRNWLGMNLARFWQMAGDILRDMDSLFTSAGVPYEEIEVGGAGSVHLYIAKKSL